LTDRVPVRRVYMLGTSLTALSHSSFALFADGFWSAPLLRLRAGIGWAGTYMAGLKAIADPLEGTAQSRAVSWHPAGVGISGAASFSIAGLIGNWAGALGSLPARRRDRLECRADGRDDDAVGIGRPREGAVATVARSPAGAS
jgi:MFS family permease